MPQRDPQARMRAVARRIPPIALQLAVRGYGAANVLPSAIRYARDWRAYRRLPGAEPLRVRNAFPKLADRLARSPYDSHYFYQDSWAAQRIAERAPDRHVDVGSRVDLVGFLTAITQVVFVDIRPLDAELEGLSSIAGSVLGMPFADGELESVSCLHVAEHVGLGRYGDPLDPSGTRRAACELQRVLASGGQLLFSLPVGRPRVEFNAHRVHDPVAVREWFDELRLAEFSAVTDDVRFVRHLAPADVRGSRYACGMYRLVRD